MPITYLPISGYRPIEILVNRIIIERRHLVKQKILTIVMAMALLCLLAGMSMASASVFGASGNILTPDDKVLDVGDFSANVDSLQLDDPVTLIGASFGIAENMEIGVANYNPSRDRADSQTVINLKYAAVKESLNMPAITVGLIDAAGEVDPDEDSGFFVVAGKNLTQAGSNFRGEPIGNLRGFIGIGGGMYQGLFAGANYTLTPKVNVIVEYLNGIKMKDAMDEDSVFNAAIKMKVTDNIGVNLGLIDMEDLSFGVTYTKLAF